MSQQVFDLKDATIKIIGGGGGEELEVLMDEGNFQFTIAKEYEYRKNRGVLDTVREQDEVPMEVSWTGRFNYITGDGDVTILEALENEKFDGADFVSLGWTSSDDRVGHECDPYCVDLSVLYDPSLSCNALAGNPIETSLFKYFRMTRGQVDLSNGTINIEGTCNSRKPQSVRSA